MRKEGIPIPRRTHSTLVAAGWLVDGTGGPVRNNILLRIRDGRLVSVEPAHSSAPLEDPVLDFSACTLLPGFVDAHVHLSMSGTSDPGIRERQIQASYDDMEPVIERHIQDHLFRGIMALRDGGDRAAHTLRYKEIRLAPSDTPVRLRAAGRAWHAPGRYGRIIGRSPRDGTSLHEAILMDEARVDHVKIVNSGLNSLVLFGKETRPQFEREALRDAVEACRNRGLSVMIHANGRDPVRGAVEAGCDSIEHGFFMGEENLHRMADRGTVWVPTACAMSALARTLPAHTEEARGAERNLHHQLQQIQEARRAGVVMALGTDSGSLGVHHGRSVAEELGLFLQAGMTVQEAIRCATWNGARLLALDHEAGRLAPGRPASFLVARGGPDRLPASLDPPLAVVVRGVAVGPPVHAPSSSTR